MIGPRRIAALYAIFAILSVLLLAPTMPPMQNADEQAHAFRADQISHLVPLGITLPNRQVGGMVDSGLPELNVRTGSMPFRRDVKVNRAWYKPLSWGTPVPTGFPNTAIYPPHFYLPAALAASFTRYAGIPLPHALVLMRIASGLVSVAITAAAIALAGNAAIWMFTVCLLPMTLALDSAVSQDGPMIACAALATAMAIGMRRPGGRHRPAAFVLICALLSAVAMARPPYAAFALVLLALPVERTWRIAGITIIVACVAGWAAIVGHLLVLPTWQAGTVSPAAQLAILARHPWRTIFLAIRTWQTHGDMISSGFLAGLGWLDVDFPAFFDPLAWTTLALAALSSWCLGRGRPSLAQAAICLAAILAASAGIALIQYLTWTAVGALSIDGIQGRYFLAPALLLALPLSRPLPATCRFAAWLAAPVLAMPIITIAVTLHALILRYYLPQ